MSMSDDDLRKEQLIKDSSIEDSKVQMAQSERGDVQQIQQNAHIINNHSYIGLPKSSTPQDLENRNQVSSDFKRERLEKQIKALQEEWALTHEKLVRFRKDLTIQAGSAVRFQLENEIKKEEAKLKQLERESEEIEAYLSSCSRSSTNPQEEGILAEDTSESKSLSVNDVLVAPLSAKDREPIDTSSNTTDRQKKNRNGSPLFSTPHPFLLMLVFVIGIVSTSPVVWLRSIGFLQILEVNVFDSLMRSRPLNKSDDRIIVVTIDKKDRDYQDQQNMGRVPDRSLSDKALSQLLQALEPYRPGAIGLDIEHSLSFETGLGEKLKKTENFIASCYIGTEDTPKESKMPPPGIPNKQLGFVDLAGDYDNVNRRQILLMTSGEECKASKSFSLQVAHVYLGKQNIQPIKKRPDGRREINGRIIDTLEYSTGGYHLPPEQVKGYQILLSYHYLDPVSIPLREVLQGKRNSDLSKCAKNCIILIGVNQPDQDRHSTIYGSKAGVIVHAHMISQILDFATTKQSLIWSLPDWQEIFFILCFSSLGSLVILARWRSLHIQGVAVLVIFFTLGSICFVCLLFEGWLPLIPSILSLLISIGVSYSAIVLAKFKRFPIQLL
jgi:CHASE2 domain-containing sensor protein